MPLVEVASLVWREHELDRFPTERPCLDVQNINATRGQSDKLRVLNIVDFSSLYESFSWFAVKFCSRQDEKLSRSHCRSVGKARHDCLVKCLAVFVVFAA